MDGEIREGGNRGTSSSAGAGVATSLTMTLLLISLGGGTAVWASAGAGATPFVWGNSRMAAMADIVDLEVEDV